MRIERLAWPWAPALLLIAGLMLTGVPEHREGPTLIVLTARHGLTLANAVAFLLLAAGGAGLLLGTWLNRAMIFNAIRTRPLPIALLVLALGLGFILLYDSGPSTTLRYWAPGALLSAAALLGLAAVTSIEGQ